MQLSGGSAEPWGDAAAETLRSLIQVATVGSAEAAYNHNDMVI
jgi:hypothetical protein